MLWYGVLLALDAVFNVREDRRTKVKIDDYLDAISERDEALAKMANEIIDRCEKMLQ